MRKAGIRKPGNAGSAITKILHGGQGIIFLLGLREICIIQDIWPNWPAIA